MLESSPDPVEGVTKGSGVDTDKIDKAKRDWFKTEKGKESLRRYRESAQGKAAQSRYDTSAKAKLARQKYYYSEKGQEAHEKHAKKVSTFKEMKNWLDRNPGKTLDDWVAEHGNYLSNES